MKTQIAIMADYEIELPCLPNFIRTTDGRQVDVKDIHNSSLVMIAEQWTKALLKHAEERRKP